MRTIPLSGRRGVDLFAIVDDEDYEPLVGFKWSLTQGYAVRYIGRWSLFMHREILGLARGDGLMVDHMNRHGLDNRRFNIRVVTSAQNPQNTSPRGGCTSQYRGVYLSKQISKWVAQGRRGGRTHHLGVFHDEIEAARAAQQFRLEHMPFSVEDVIL